MCDIFLNNKRMDGFPDGRRGPSSVVILRVGRTAMGQKLVGSDLAPDLKIEITFLSFIKSGNTSYVTHQLNMLSQVLFEE